MGSVSGWAHRSEDGERLSAAYAEADLLVLPSRIEAYGMVVTEALARGIPVLAAAVGGVPESLGYDPGGRVPGIRCLRPRSRHLPRRCAAGSATRRCGTAARHGARRRDTLDGWGVTSRCLAEVLER